MAAARVGPEPATVVFVVRALLQEQFALAVEDEHAEGPVQDAFLVGGHFLHGPLRFVQGVHEHHLLFHHFTHVRSCSICSARFDIHAENFGLSAQWSMARSRRNADKSSGQS